MVRVVGQVQEVMMEMPVRDERLSRGFDSCDTLRRGGTGLRVWGRGGWLDSGRSSLWRKRGPRVEAGWVKTLEA